MQSPKQKVTAKRFRQRNKKRLAEVLRVWSTANRDKRNATNAKWKKNNKAKVAAMYRRWRRENRNKVVVYGKVYRAQPEYKVRATKAQVMWRKRHINARLKREYGIDSKQYRLMLKSQHGLCAICAKPETNKINRKRARLGVDHNHRTGKVRELLCCRCNAVLGFACEDILVLKAAIAYLRKHGDD